MTADAGASMQADVALRKGAATIRISEIYASRQGEGLLTGTPSVFLRTSGCNLRCSFCDTKFASWKPDGQQHSIDMIMNSVCNHSVQHVVVTGGEPMIFSGMLMLTERLKSAGLHITIETAGTMFRPVSCDLMSISPKLSNSTPTELGATWRQLHERRRERVDVVQQLMTAYEYQLKFVIDTPSDTVEVLGYLDRLKSFEPDRVLMMPQGTEVAILERTEQWLRPWCDEKGFRFSPRAHIAWFGNRRGT